jgi:hypothetical protein
MLFDKKTAKNDLAELKKLCQEVALAQWGAKLPTNLRNPFKDGDQENQKRIAEGKEPQESNKGMIYVQSKSSFMPGLVNQKREPIINQDEFYGGCYARAQVNVYAYSQAGNNGVNLGLLHIQKVKDGDPFGNRSRPEDAFSPIETDEFLAEETPAVAGGMFD